MPRTASKIDALADEGEEMVDALEAVLEQAEEQGTVEWADVSDDLTSGQWGRLIEKGLLVDGGGNGFVVDDPEGVRDALEDADPTPPDVDGDSSWSTLDKAAGGGSLLMMVGYSQDPIRNAIGHALNVFLGPLNDALPFYLVILILAALTGTYSTLLRSELMDTETISKYQERMQAIQEREKAAKERGDDEALERIREEKMEAAGDNLGMMKEQMRPMGWIMLITIPIFLWMYWQILEVGASTGNGPAMIMPFLGEVTTWQATVAGPIQAWIVWYFVCSIVMTQIIQKALDIDMSPSAS